MQTLDIDGIKDGTELPASRFPEFAERYVCDKCGRDITSTSAFAPRTRVAANRPYAVPV
jgi:hypothetical protein